MGDRLNKVHFIIALVCLAVQWPPSFYVGMGKMCFVCVCVCVCVCVRACVHARAHACAYVRVNVSFIT